MRSDLSHARIHYAISIKRIRVYGSGNRCQLRRMVTGTICSEAFGVHICSHIGMILGASDAVRLQVRVFLGET